MNINNVKQVFKKMIETKFKGTPMLWGRHGLGKSSAIRQVASEQGYRLIDLRLAQKEAIDITGMLFTFEDKALNMAVTANHPPQWFADALKNGKVVLFLDEFNMARREVMNAVFELVLDRKLNNVALPDDVFIVCAGNPEDDRYDVQPMSESLVDRLLHIKVEPSVDGWLDHAEKSDCDSRITAFIRANPTALFHPNKLDEKFPVSIKHSERTWLDRADAILKLELSEDLQHELLCGAIGQEVAILFSKTIKKDNMPVSVKEIFAGKKETLERVTRYRNTNRQDLLAISVGELVEYAKKHPVEMVKHVDKVIAFIHVLPPESAMVAITGTRLIEGYAKAYTHDEKILKQMQEMGEVHQKVKKDKGIK